MQSFSLPPSVIPFLLISFAALAEALEAVDCGSKEEAGHYGCNRDRDAGEDDNEVVSEAEDTPALSETFFRE